MSFTIFNLSLLRRVQAICILAVSCAAFPAKSADYTLAPGDVLHLEVAGIEQFSTIAPISNDGFLSLPHFGSIIAEGRTLDELRATLEDMVGSITFRVLDASRIPSVLEIGPSDIYLSVERYRDVSVLGFVARPGLIPFSHGMTVRSAIAAAGGYFREGSTGSLPDLAGAATELAKIKRLERDRAETLARIWRLESALGQTQPLPSATELGVDQADAEVLLALQSEILEIGNEDYHASLALLDSLDRLFAKRIETLTEGQKYQAEALEADRQELARISQLEERGLIRADRLHGMTRTQYLSEAQLFQTQGEIERLRIQRAESQDERRRLNTDRREEGLEALAEARSTLFGLDSEIAGAWSAYALAVPYAAQDAPISVSTEAIVRRGTGDRVVEIRPGLDALVQPGDVIEVVVTETSTQ